MDDGWYAIEGEIIGWLHKDQGSFNGTVAVVRIDHWDDGGVGWTYSKKSPFPVLCLRWIHNDCSIFDSESGEEWDGEKGDGIGMKIMFSTSRAEQEQYAAN